ncbi:MAG: hypothetical protein WCL06_16400 [Bacteroidota bacterium]
MIKRLLLIIFTSLVFHISCYSQNLIFKNLLEFHKKNDAQISSVLLAKKGWSYFGTGIDVDFYDFNYHKWYFNSGTENDNSKNLLYLCQKSGCENAIIFVTTTEKYNEIKKEVSADYHWKPVESFYDKQGGEHYIFNWSKYNIEFVQSDEIQVLLYNTKEIQTFKLEKQKKDKVADSIALVKAAIAFRFKQIQDSILAVKAKREMDSIRKENEIAAAIEKKNVQGKTYNLREFDIYKKIYSNIISSISDYLKTIPYGSRINTVYKIKLSLDTSNKTSVIPLENGGLNVPPALLGYMTKSCNTYYYPYPNITGYAVNSETDLLIPVVFEKGSVKLFRKKNGKININIGNPSQQIYREICSEVNSKGVYFFDYTEKKIDDKSDNIVTQSNYKRTTVFRSFMTVFWSAVGIGGLVTLAAMLPANP